MLLYLLTSIFIYSEVYNRKLSVDIINIGSIFIEINYMYVKYICFCSHLKCCLDIGSHQYCFKQPILCGPVFLRWFIFDQDLITCFLFLVYYLYICTDIMFLISDFFIWFINSHFILCSIRRIISPPNI